MWILRGCLVITLAALSAAVGAFADAGAGTGATCVAGGNTISIALDQSGSMMSYFDSARDMVVRFIEGTSGLPGPANDNLYAVGFFSVGVTQITGSYAAPFTTNKDGAVSDLVASTEPRYGGTNIPSALAGMDDWWARFERSGGDISADNFRGSLVAARSASIHARSAGIAILVSDGNGGSVDDISAKAQLMKDRGVLVVAVGLGQGISLSTLRAAASWQGGTQLVFTDSDNDGTSNCQDSCPTDPLKTDPGVCGCHTEDTDSDDDGTPDCIDSCPNDPRKTAPGECGCGALDTDFDGTDDCEDGCPEDGNKDEPGQCGCGIPDMDTDSDGVLDCEDECPDDPSKITEEICGCGVPDVDSNSNGVMDCVDVVTTPETEADGGEDEESPSPQPIADDSPSEPEGSPLVVPGNDGTCSLSRECAGVGVYGEFGGYGDERLVEDGVSTVGNLVEESTPGLFVEED